MEDTDGRLHPAVDGQSLDEDEDEDITYIILRVPDQNGISYACYIVMTYNSGLESSICYTVYNGNHSESSISCPHYHYDT